MKKSKFFLNILYSVIIAVAVEGIISIVPNYYKNNVQGYKEARLTLENFDMYNWSEEGNGSYVSLPDPILVIEDLQANIKDIDITVDSADNISSVTFFYTENDGQVFNGDNIILGNLVDSELTLSVNKYVNDIRIDLGDDAGMRINGVTVVLNPDRIKFSFTRFITVIILYFSTIFLFRLQRRPDYTELENISDGS